MIYVFKTSVMTEKAVKKLTAKSIHLFQTQNGILILKIVTKF
jgi:hypothetical protein